MTLTQEARADLADIVRMVRRRQHGWTGRPSLSEELLLRHPHAAWCANVYYRHGVWAKLKRLSLVTGTIAKSRLTSRGYLVREEILKARRLEKQS